MATETLPFHESIINVIHIATDSDLEMLALLIGTTMIPANHDQISQVWNDRIARSCSETDFGVPAHLQVQKAEAQQRGQEQKQQWDKLLKMIDDTNQIMEGVAVVVMGAAKTKNSD